MIVWDTIAPGELLLSQINWGPRLSGDTITNSVWSASVPPGLTLTPASPAWTPTVTQIWTSNAAIGTTYTITNTINTASGAIEVETVQVTCALK